MITKTEEQKWLDKIPAHSREYIKALVQLGEEALQDKAAYHSIQIGNDRRTAAGTDKGRILGWAVTCTAQLGWEYQNVVMDPTGTMTVLFKNPYLFT